MSPYKISLRHDANNENMYGSSERDNLCNNRLEIPSLLDFLYCIFTLPKNIYDHAQTLAFRSDLYQEEI